MTDIILDILLRIVEQILIHFVKKCIDRLFEKRKFRKKRAKNHAVSYEKAETISSAVPLFTIKEHKKALIYTH